VETKNRYYNVSETPIKDLSVLGTHGEKLCKNIDVHWMTLKKTCKCLHVM